MLEFVIIIAFVGSLIAGILDLKTTEFPEDIPYLMIAIGLFIWYIYALTSGDFLPLILSISLGTIFGILGWIAYKLGAWGDGDAAIISAIFFLIPSLSFIMPFIFNLLIISIIYLVIYAVIIGVRKKVSFIKDVKKWWRIFLIYIIILPAVILANYYFNLNIYTSSILWIFGLLMILFTIYAKSIEKTVFKRRIPASQIKEGDVLASSRQWIGITKEDAEKIRKNLKYVEIKEGVRFSIVFPITIAVTVFLGNLLLILLL